MTTAQWAQFAAPDPIDFQTLDGTSDLRNLLPLSSHPTMGGQMIGSKPYLIFTPGNR